MYGKKRELFYALSWAYTAYKILTKFNALKAYGNKLLACSELS
jgi:hypothetical protein